MLRPRAGQKEPPRLGSTICYGHELARKSHQDSAARLVTAKRAPERAIKTRQYDLLRPRVGQKKPPRLGSTSCYGQTWARKGHQVRFVTAKSWPEGATKTRQYDLLRPRLGQTKPPRLGSTICYGQTWARKSHQDSAVRFVTAKRGPEISHQDSPVRFVKAKSWPEKATKTRQHDLLRPNVGQKEPSRLGSTICYGQELARKSHQDSAVRFVTAKRGPERATKTRQYELLRPRRGPERATKTRQYDLLRPRVGQKEPPRLGSTNCYGQELARKSHQDSAIRFITAKSGPERATKTRQYDLLRPNVGQKEPPRLGSTICYGQQKQPPRLGSTICYCQTWARKSPRLGSPICYGQVLATWARKSQPRLGSTICYGQELARKSHQDSAVRLVTAKRGPERPSAICYGQDWPEGATKTRQYDLLRPRLGQELARKSHPPRLGGAICYGQELGQKGATKTRQYDLLRPNELARKSHQDSAVRFVTAKSWPERATKTRQYDLLRPRVGQKEPPCDLLRPRVGKKEPPRLGSTICCGQEFGHKKSHQDSAVRFVTAKSWPERATKTRQYDLLRPNVGQKEPPRLGSTSCYGQELARKSHQDSTVLFVAAKSEPERATKTRQYDLLPEKATKTRQYDLLRPNVGQEWARTIRQYDLLRPRVGQKEASRFGSTICYGQEWARKNQQDSAIPCVTAKSAPERAAKTRQYDLLRPRIGQKEPPRLGSTICYGQDVGQKEPPRLGSTICYGQTWPERATETRQYDLLRPNVGQKEPPRLGSTMCYGQELARKSHQDSAVRFVTAKSWPERATKTRQYDLLRPNVGQKEPSRLGSTICYGQELARKSHQDSAVRFVTAKRGPERATKTRQYDLLRPNVGQKEPSRLGSTICYGQT